MLFPPVPTETPPPTAPVILGDLVVDVPGHLVTWRGEPLALTRLERELLARLATPPVVVWTYERLFGTVWGGAYLGDTAILHSAVKRLRRKLRSAGGGLEIQTVRGVGYRLATPATADGVDDGYPVDDGYADPDDHGYAGYPGAHLDPLVPTPLVPAPEDQTVTSPADNRVRTPA